jgi:hypothetical protein
MLRPCRKDDTGATGAGRNDVPVAAGQSRVETAPAEEAQARDAHRVAQFRHGRLEGRPEGEHIVFTLVNDTDFMYRQRVGGKVTGNTMEGTARGEGTAPRGEYRWRAVRAAP